MQQYLSWIVKICIEYSTPKMKITVREKNVGYRVLVSVVLVH